MTTSRRWVAALAAATLMLTACSSAGSADPSTATSTPSATATGSKVAAEIAATGSSAPAPQSLAEVTSAGATSAGSDAEPSTTTLAAEVDALDEQTAAFFSQACTSLAGMRDMEASKVTKADLQGDLSALAGDDFITMGEHLIEQSEVLRDTTAPSFDGGEEFAGALVTGLSAMGTKMIEGGEQLNAGDPAAATTLTEAISTEVSLSSTEMNPELQDDVLALPACAAMVG